MSLISIIQNIPKFIAETIKNPQPSQMLGKFHLGLQYDMNIWL